MKKLLFVLIPVLTFIFLACNSGEVEKEEIATPSENIQEVIQEGSPESGPGPAGEPGSESDKRAREKALSYLEDTAFSYSGLVEQLENEGFTNEEAIYAVEYSGADWDEQAKRKAQDLLDYSSFSRESLIEQLESEGFSRQQAEYAVEAVGY